MNRRSDARPTVWVLGDQLNRHLGALRDATPDSHRVLLVESSAKLASKRWHRATSPALAAASTHFPRRSRRAPFPGSSRNASQR